MCWHGCGFGGDSWRRELLDIRSRSDEGGYKLGVDVGVTINDIPAARLGFCASYNLIVAKDQIERCEHVRMPTKNNQSISKSTPR
jgi:hypothetical protein